MEDKNNLLVEYFSRLRDEFFKRGYLIPDETYEALLKKYSNSDKSLAEIKGEIELLVAQKIEDIKAENERKRLEQVNIEDYQNVLLTLKSLDERGYPKEIYSQLEFYNRVKFSHNAPINIGFGNKNGFFKNSAQTSIAAFDKYEYIICQIGKMLGVKMAETHKVYYGDSYLGIISENVCEPNETLYTFSNILELLNVNNSEIQGIVAEREMLSHNKSYAMEDAENDANQIPMVDNEEEVKTVIDSFLKVINTLKISEDNKNALKQNYFNMLMLDYLVNNKDRNRNNCGLIIREDGSIRFSPLFDNSAIIIPGLPDGYQQINGFLVNKTELLNCLFSNYYEYISGISQYCANNGEQMINNVANLCNQELDSSDTECFLAPFANSVYEVAQKELTKDEEQVKGQNLDVGPKLVKIKPESPEETTTPNNGGKINIVMLLLSISLVFILITIIMLFKL